jgi:hypothetical protein
MVMLVCSLIKDCKKYAGKVGVRIAVCKQGAKWRGGGGWGLGMGLLVV